MSAPVAADRLRAFVERIERVEEEIKALNADKSEIYKELRGDGFDVKAVRQCVSARKLDSAEREERNAIFDLYWDALTGGPRVHVHEDTHSSGSNGPETKAEAKGDEASRPDASATPSPSAVHPAEAGAVNPIPPAAAPADPFDIGDIPEFLRRTDGYPKREAVQ